MYDVLLQDLTNLQSASNLRAFSNLTPLEEFRIDAGAAYVQLLHDFRQKCVQTAFIGPDLEEPTKYVVLPEEDEELDTLKDAGASSNKEEALKP